MSGYRQQSLFKELQVKNSHTIRCQKLRLNEYIQSYEKASKLGLDIVIMEDTNIDTNPKIDYYIKYNNKDPYNSWLDTIIGNNWVFLILSSLDMLFIKSQA